MSKLFKLSITTISSITTAVFTRWLLNNSDIDYQVHTASYEPNRNPQLILRDQQIINLRNGEEFDVLVIGGGITGAGCALDAATRGLKTALVESSDFGSGASSKSTKLLHAGIRNLQSAISSLDYEKYKLAKEAALERKTILEIAPHLTQSLPIMVPIYNYSQLPYYWTLLKVYDHLARHRKLKRSYFLSKTEALKLFPMLNKEKLKGGIVYYDGQMDDARLNLAVALTAARYGATVCNYVEVINLHKLINSDGEQILNGARVRDHISGKTFNIRAKCIINATGPYTDTIREMDDITAKPICSPSAGTHLILPDYYCSKKMGLLDPYTSDGRVIFFLPWKNHTIVGTTDAPTELTNSPRPRECEVIYILSEIKKYLNSDVEVRRGDVLSAWCGTRPLVRDPNYPYNNKLSQKHIIHISRSKLVTIAGGKLTIYRKMAEETVDAAITACSLVPKLKKSITNKIKVDGSLCWTPTIYIRLIQDFGLEYDVAHHLTNSYGSKAFSVAKFATSTGKRWPIIGNKIHPQLPYIEAEIRYGIHEYTCTAIDMIARRLHLSSLNVEAAKDALPKIVDILAEDLKWDEQQKQGQLKKAYNFLDIEMGGELNKLIVKPLQQTNLAKDEIDIYINRFKIIDKDQKGFISINDIRRTMKCFGEDDIAEDQIHQILNQVDATMNGQVDINEYLQMMSIMKTGRVAYDQNKGLLINEVENLKKNIEIERSCGGV